LSAKGDSGDIQDEAAERHHVLHLAQSASAAASYLKGPDMTIQTDMWLGGLILLAVAVLVLSVAIVALRWLRNLLLVAALVLGIGAGGALYEKHKHRLSLPNIPGIRLEIQPLKNPPPAATPSPAVPFFRPVYPKLPQ
jgi:hypothetical protein